MNEQQIIKEIKRRCRLFGVRFEQHRSINVKLGDGTFCSGFFQTDPKEGPVLVISKSNSDHFLGTLLHEYCHVTQWVENCTIWRQDDESAKHQNIDEWINSGRPCSKGMRKAIAIRRDLEADNERRTVRLIKEFNAPVDLSTYIQRANSYVHFYNTIPETNRWYSPQRVPYKVPIITELFNSDKIDDDFSKTPQKLFKALVSCADS